MHIAQVLTTVLRYTAPNQWSNGIVTWRYKRQTRVSTARLAPYPLMCRQYKLKVSLLYKRKRDTTPLWEQKRNETSDLETFFIRARERKGFANLLINSLFSLSLSLYLQRKPNSCVGMTPRWCWKIFGNTTCWKWMRAPAPSSRQLNITIKRQLLLFSYCRLVTLLSPSYTFHFFLLFLRCHQYCMSHMDLTKTTIRFDVPVTLFECVTCPLVDSVRADKCGHDDSWL